jgi:hypothetical protein
MSESENQFPKTNERKRKPKGYIMEQQKASENFCVALSAMLSGSKTVNQIVKANNESMEISDFDMLVLKRERASKEYDEMFNPKNQIYKRFNAEEIQRRKTALHEANKAICEYSH